jgi:hypothetical protein
MSDPILLAPLLQEEKFDFDWNLKKFRQNKRQNDINSKFWSFMASFYCLSPKKLTWKIQATLWNAPGRSHTYGGDCNKSVKKYIKIKKKIKSVIKYNLHNFRENKHWKNFRIINDDCTGWLENIFKLKIVRPNCDTPIKHE